MFATLVNDIADLLDNDPAYIKLQKLENLAICYLCVAMICYDLLSLFNL